VNAIDLARGSPLASQASGQIPVFRPDVQGLRAMAILLVVANHCGIPFLRGGYIGVDVFFVISGFVITRLLLAELDASGRLNLAAFYARRAARLLPAFMAMLLVVSVVSAVVLAPFEQALESRVALFATAWLSNVWFALADVDYFSPAVESSALLHTWSLGVEEQFYVLWPALLLFFLGAWRWQGQRLSFTRLWIALALTVLVSLALFLLLTVTKPLWAFYLMPARVWQFALGALVCGMERRWIHQPPARWHHALSWCGLSLVAGFLIWQAEARPHPSVLALVPSLGTAMVLVAGSSHSSVGAGAILSSAIAQWIGARSYSWYLWHWPMLTIGGWLSLRNGVASSLLLIGMSLGLAALSFRHIEAPLQTWLRRSCTTRGVMLLALAFVLASSLCLLGWTWSATRWSQSPEQARYLAAQRDAPVIYQMGCDTWIHSGEVTTCEFLVPGATRSAVLIGDSVAAQWVPALIPIFQRAGWNFRVITKASCPVVEVPNLVLSFGIENRPYRECEAWRPRALRAVDELGADVVFIGSSSYYNYSRTQWIEGTARVLNAIANGSRQVFVLAPSPELPFDGASCLARRQWQSRLAWPVQVCEFSIANSQVPEVTASLSEAASRVAGSRVLELNELICPSGKCMAERDGQIVFRDRRHLTASFSSRLDAELEQRFLAEAIRAAEAD